MNRKTGFLIAALLTHWTAWSWANHGDEPQAPGASQPGHQETAAEGLAESSYDFDGAGCGLEACPFHSHVPTGTRSSEDSHKKEEAPANVSGRSGEAAPAQAPEANGSPNLSDSKAPFQPDLSPAGHKPPPAALLPAPRSAPLDPRLDSDEFWMEQSADTLAQAENTVTRMLEASRQGVTALPQRVSRLASSILHRIWHASKHEISRKIVRELPEEYRAQDPVYAKPAPVRRTYDVSTNGPVSEIFVATLCEEMGEAGIQNVDLINRCQSVIYDRSAFRF